jgi:hypothetical protein
MANQLSSDPFGNKTVVPKYGWQIQRNTDAEYAAAFRLCPEDVREILGMTQ